MIQTIGKILKLVTQYWRFVILSVIFNLLSVVFSLFSITMALPFLGILFGKQKMVMTQVPFELSADAIQHNFNYFISQLIIEKGPSTALLMVTVIIVVMSLFKTAFTYLSVHFMTPVRHRVLEDIRNRLYEKILVLPLSFYSNEKKGDIISRMTNDVKEIEISVISSLEMLFIYPITILVYLSSLIWISPHLTFIVLILIPIIGFILGKISKELRKQSRQGQRRIAGITAIMDETLFGLRIIKAFNAEEKVTKHFNLANRLYTKLMIALFRRRSLASPLTEFLGTIIMVSIMWYGGSLVLDGGTLSAEAFIGYILIFSQIISPAKAFSSATYNIQKGMASLERINEITEAKITVVDKIEGEKIKTLTDKIEYKNVSFQYEQEKGLVLKNINLTVEKGKVIALVGQSGSGKSTLVDLLPRFFDVTGGSIMIDNIDIRDYKLSELRSLFGIVNQEAILFNDTFFNNIAFGLTDVKLEEVIHAAKIANAHEFIMAMPNQYYTNIGDHGNKLSGGQRQRISIARAILRNPAILILDEATSALDSESEKMVQEALEKLMENRTSIVIAHRLSTIFNADEIIVMHEGEIVERGKHQDLLNKQGYYKKLYDLQIFK